MFQTDSMSIHHRLPQTARFNDLTHPPNSYATNEINELKQAIKSSRKIIVR